MSERPLIACLLPVRNGEERLEGWFASAARFADVVVALDDGSTDGTRSFLDADPLATVVLSNPVRDSYAGWDDRANRTRLLEAAGALRPSWIVQLDADERIQADDAAALRDFLESAADRSNGYLVPVFRMVDDLDHYDDASLTVGRIFAWEPGLRFPEDRLHFVALPTCIPPERRVRTTVRVQHLGALTARDRADRYRKYRESDPDSEFHPDYRRLLKENATRVRWRERGPRLPVVMNGPWHREAIESTPMAGAPSLSAVVIARNDAPTIADALQAVVDQDCPEPFEVIVVTSGDDDTASIVRKRFPDVHLVELDGVALPGRARNAGLAVARGRYVTFPGSHVRLLPGALAARLEAHRLGYAMVTGPMSNGTLTWSGWASYFLDHNTVLPERPSEPLRQSPAHCSYAREVLTSVGGFPEDLRSGEDTMVNDALFAAGYGAWFASNLRAVHHSPCRTPGRLARHHFTRGRGLARVLLRQQQPGTRLLTMNRANSLGVKLVPGRVVKVHRAVKMWGGPALERRWRMALPLAVFAVTCFWVGLWLELLRPGRGRLRALFWKSPVQ